MSALVVEDMARISSAHHRPWEPWLHAFPLIDSADQVFAEFG
ncbi:hypothetical protein I551_8783, partial [Mycobacterium ulcerans str. Harvey]